MGFGYDKETECNGCHEMFERVWYLDGYHYCFNCKNEKDYVRKEEPASMTYPHCDSRVLHRKGICKYCDMHPDWQELRESWNINFTGEHYSDKSPCPSEIERPLEIIENWPGNRAYPE